MRPEMAWQRVSLSAFASLRWEPSFPPHDPQYRSAASSTDKARYGAVYVMVSDGGVDSAGPKKRT